MESSYSAKNSRKIDNWNCRVELAEGGECKVDVGGINRQDASDNAIRRLIERGDMKIVCRDNEIFSNVTGVSW